MIVTFDTLAHDTSADRSRNKAVSVLSPHRWAAWASMGNLLVLTGGNSQP